MLDKMQSTYGTFAVILVSHTFLASVKRTIFSLVESSQSSTSVIPSSIAIASILKLVQCVLVGIQCFLVCPSGHSMNTSAPPVGLSVVDPSVQILIHSLLG